MAAELRTAALSAGYGRTIAIRDVSLVMASGELTCLLGPNGAGKTTLLRVLAGLLRPSAGEVELEGVPLAAMTARARARRIAYVPQVSPDGLPLTVREMVSLGRQPRLAGRFHLTSADRAAIDGALDALGLCALADRPCFALSGGEWRRMLIAQGLAQEPEVLLLDEPTAFLDPPARYQVLAHVRSLAAERGLIAAAAVHDVHLARTHADYAVLLREGCVVASGTPASILDAAHLSELYACPADWLGLEEAHP
jgi:iron complex transport system ATP-binding protein